jgi:superfamily I DNA/RNA helicase
MRIVVAGAGAGKTTSMAHSVLERLNEVSDGKKIYVITYTNAARNRIREKITELYGSLPRQVIIETSHAFLLREIIFPFHHLLYGQQFTKVSHIKLSDNPIFSASKIKELISNKIVHVEKVTEIAKWVIFRKSGDKLETKKRREKILQIIMKYLDSVFVDEAQDIDNHFAKIIEVLHSKGINMNLVGDPKQDLRGRNAFKELVSNYKEFVEYKAENNRCPVSHVNLANTFVSIMERQLPQKAEIGTLNYIYESGIRNEDKPDFVSKSGWDYVFISKKNDRYITNVNDKNECLQNLSYELRQLVKKTGVSESEIDKCVFMLVKNILKDLKKDHNNTIFSKLEKLLSIELTRQDKGRVGAVLLLSRGINSNKGILVNSIDSIKGLEGEKCLFILTTDLVEYLFREKRDQNKMMNYLYVGLTRAKKELTFFVSLEVELKYGQKVIDNIFDELSIMKYMALQDPELIQLV